MLLEFLGCIILAAVVEYILWFATASFFERRFFKKANAIFILYDSIYYMIEDNFNRDNLMKVSAKYEFCGCKIKFKNALEASLKFEILVQRALKNYHIVKYLIDGIAENFESTEISMCKNDLEKCCYEIRKLIINNKQEGQKKEL